MHTLRPIQGVGWQIGRAYWQTREPGSFPGEEVFAPMFETADITQAMQLVNCLNGGDGGLSLAEIRRLIKGCEPTLMLKDYEEA